MKKSVLVFLSLLSLSPLLYGEPDLIPIGPFGGDVRSLAIHPSNPSVVFLGTADGQIFISEDFGNEWEKLVPGIGRRELVIDSLEFHPDDPSTLYAGGWELKSNQGYLYRTRDSGKTWESISLDRFHSSVRAVAISPVDPDLIAVGISEGVIISQDGGRSWDRITRGYRSLHNVHSLAFHPNERETLYVGTFRLAWKTENLGQDWEPIHEGMFWDSDLFTILIHPESPEIVFASACSGIYKSENAGGKWNRLREGLPDEAKRVRALQFDPANLNVLYGGTTVGLFRTEDAGVNWEPLLQDVVINAIVVDPRDSSRILLGTDDAGVLLSTDRARTFEPSNNGFVQRQVAAVAVAETGEIYAGISLDRHHGGFFLSRDSGESWTQYNQGLGTAVAGIRTILPSSRTDQLFLGTNQGVFVGLPGSEDWKKIDSTRNLVISDIAFADGEKGLYLAAKQGLFHLTLESQTLRPLEIPVYDREFYSVLHDPETQSIYVGTDMGVFRSKDEGESWTIKVKDLPYTAVNEIQKFGDRLFAGTRDGLFYSDDLGETWQEPDGVFPIAIGTIQANLKTTGQIYAADVLVGYLFISHDWGSTWEAINIRNTASKISSLVFSNESGKLLAGTISEGVFQILPPSTQASLQSSGSE